MSEQLLLDRYLADGQEAVLQRAQWACDTHEFYGLQPESAVIIGSRALDMYGIDGRPPVYANGIRTGHIDLDVVAPPSEVARFKRDHYNPYDESGLDVFDEQESHHNFQLAHGDRQIDVLGKFYRGDKYKVDFDIAAATAQPITVEDRPGTYMVQVPEIAAEWKLTAGGVKDVLAVMFAHASAYRQGHGIVASPAWQRQVRLAVDMSGRLHPTHQPDWFVELHADAQGVTRHPAFASLAS
ncbi:MAG TPA: hypothetical protein VD735_03710 [Candidatus Saccharimonadales bacterium]|nr:hypothetical protein [Candidatus Saccharimonadales bacterium]